MFKSVKFRNFKSLKDYSVTLAGMNVLVGPNNSGKSTLLDGFRALAGAWRYVRRFNPIPITLETQRRGLGYRIPTSSIPISLSNIHSDYREVETSVTFTLENENRVEFIVDSQNSPILLLHEEKTTTRNTGALAKNFPITLSIVPTLGPFDELETIIKKETLDGYGYSGGRQSHRVFRNLWYQYPEEFEAFAEAVRESWNHITVLKPEIVDFPPPRLGMFFKEGNIDREIYWAGFGFQVWLQLLTHLFRLPPDATLIIDEPDIYLHPDLQHRLFRTLRRACKQTVLATHSVEIINDAEPEEIVVIRKTERGPTRLLDIEGVQQAIFNIGSTHNIQLSKLSRDRKILFFEGQDHQLIRRFSARLGFETLATQLNVNVVPLGGFSEWRKMRETAWTFEKILETNVNIAGLFDRDYRSDEEIAEFLKKMREITEFCYVLDRKEIENYLINERAIARATLERLKDRGISANLDEIMGVISEALGSFSEEHKPHVLGQTFEARRLFFMRTKNQPTILTETSRWLEQKWKTPEGKYSVIPGKEVMSELGRFIQEKFRVSISPTIIVRNMMRDDVPADFVEILSELNRFAKAA